MADKIVKFIQAQDKKIQNLVINRLKELKINPFNGGDIKKLKGYKNYYRLRIGKIRIIYIVDKHEKVKIIDIDFRGNIY